jgi:hypothetical protein
MKLSLTNQSPKHFTLSLLVLFITILFSTNSFAQTKNFTGNWHIIHDQSDFGRYAESVIPFEITLEQSKDALSIKRTNKNDAGDISSYTENLPLNGSVVESMIKTTKKKSSFQQSNGNSFIETANYRDETYDKSYSGKEIWTLSADGKTLTIVRTDDGDVGHYESKLVYNKN